MTVPFFQFTYTLNTFLLVANDMKHILLTLLLIITLASPIVSLHVKQEDESNDEKLGEVKTFLKSPYNYFVSKSGNVVWAGALTLAWHQLTDNIIKENLELESTSNIVKHLVDNYNTCPFTKNDLNQADYYVKSGFGQKTVATINKQVKKKFPNKSFPDIDTILGDKDIISYGYLAKTFKYPVPFQKNPVFLFKNQTVDGFYASNDEQKQQVGYFYYESKSDFLIKVNTKNQKEGVYYLRTNNKSESVQSIIKKVTQWSGKYPEPIDSRDVFSMPVVDLDYFREVGQLQNKKLLNQGFQNYAISQIYEALKLKIDETGVKVQNQGAIMIRTMSSPMFIKRQPKYFILNQTFWIVLKQAGKHPYLCIQVNQPKQKQ